MHDIRMGVSASRITVQHHAASHSCILMRAPALASACAGRYNYCPVPDSGQDAVLYAGVALLAACLLQGRLSALWVFICGALWAGGSLIPIVCHLRLPAAEHHVPILRPTFGPTEHDDCGNVLLCCHAATLLCCIAMVSCIRNKGNGSHAVGQAGACSC